MLVQSTPDRELGFEKNRSFNLLTDTHTILAPTNQIKQNPVATEPASVSTFETFPRILNVP